MINKFKGEIALLIAVIIWGYGFVATGQTLQDLSVFQLLFYRFIIASLTGAIIFWKKIAAMNRRAFRKGVILGSIQFIGFCFQTAGLLFTTTSNNAFLTAVYVVIVPAIAYLIFRRKPDIYETVGAVIAIIGIGVLTYTGGSRFNTGDILTLMCALSFAIQIFYTTVFVKDDDPVKITMVMIFTCLVLSALALPVEGKQFIVPHGKTWLPLIFLGFGSSMFSSVLQNYGQKFTTETRAAIFFSTEALWGTIFSVLVLHEAVTMKLIIGGALILSAIIIAEAKFGFRSVPQVQEPGFEKGNI